MLTVSSRISPARFRIGGVLCCELIWIRQLERAFLGRADPEVVTEGVAQTAIGPVEALGRLLGELDSLGDQFL